MVVKPRVVDVIGLKSVVEDCWLVEVKEFSSMESTVVDCSVLGLEVASEELVDPDSKSVEIPPSVDGLESTAEVPGMVVGESMKKKSITELKR